MKAPKFVVTITCQGQPFYHFYNNLFSAVYGFIYQYIKKKKYGTMRFSLDELYDVDAAYKAWKNEQGLLRE